MTTIIQTMTGYEIISQDGVEVIHFSEDGYYIFNEFEKLQNAERGDIIEVVPNGDKFVVDEVINDYPIEIQLLEKLCVGFT